MSHQWVTQRYNSSEQTHRLCSTFSFPATVSSDPLEEQGVRQSNIPGQVETLVLIHGPKSVQGSKFTKISLEKSVALNTHLS